MKKLLIAVVIYSALYASAAAASCGLKPLTPLGCSSQNAVCTCSPGGQCEWVFIGCR